MNRGTLSALVGRLRDSVRAADAGGLSDADLLQRWLKCRDEAAFELLVWRHGRLVLSVCRRLLPSAQDVEDAFQATFLVLVRKASAIARKQAVASWLYTVAYRIAAQARARAARLAAQSADVEQLPGAEPPNQTDARELRLVLDEEVNRLPEKYRLPFILCHLEGKTNEEAARELGCPLGTVLSRLSRARDRLRQRLTRRGLAPTASLALIHETVSSELVSSTARAAVALAGNGAAVGAVSAPVAALVEGAIRTMFIAKMKAALAVVLSVAIVGAGGGLGYRSLSAQDEGSGAKKATGGKSADELPEETRKLLKLVEKLTQELQETQDRADMLRAKLTHAQDQLGLKRTNPPKKPATGAARDPNVEDEQDRVELLRARLNVKQAELHASKALLDEAKLRLEGALKAGRSVPGSISRDDLNAARVTVDRYKSEVLLKEADLLEASILVKQAERRLKRLVESGGGSSPTLEERVAELEKQMNELRKRRWTDTVPPSGAK